MRRGEWIIFKLAPLRFPSTRAATVKSATTIKHLIAVAALLLLAMFSAAQVRAATYTVSSTQDSGNGSLRRAINSANGNPGSTIAFNISTGDSNYNSATGVFTITLASALPAVTASTIIDATTQTNTNPSTLGAGGTVGVDRLTLSIVNRPEIQLVGNNAIATGFDVQASNVTIRGFAIYGFGATSNNDSSANIRIGAFTGTLIEQNIIGAKATTFTDPGAGVRSVGDDVRFVGASGGTIRNNLIGFSQGKGIGIEASTTGVTISNNEIRGNGITNSNLDGVEIENSSSTITVSGNLIVGIGVDSYPSTGSTNRFRFVIPVPAGVAWSSILTATATLASNISEFSQNVTVTLPPNVALAKCVMSGAQGVNSIADAAQNALLTYRITYTNTGGTHSSNLVVADGIPANTDFKIGSATNPPGTSGLTVVIAYSNDNGTTWTYAPVSGGGGGAIAGYDRSITKVRWAFTGNLSQTAPNNTGSVGFTVRIR